MRFKIFLLTILLPAAAWLSGATAPRLEIEFTDKAVKGELAGRQFYCLYPQLFGPGGAEFPEQVRCEARRALLAYPGGATAAMYQDGDKLLCRLENAQTITAFKQFLFLPVNTTRGSEFQLDENPIRPFPPIRQSSGPLLNGRGKCFTLTTADAIRLSFRLRAETFRDKDGQADLRAGWHAVSGQAFLYSIYQLLTPAEHHEVILQFTSERLDSPQPFVDRFGQPLSKEFAGKIRTEAELVADLEADRIYYNSLQPPHRTQSGGLPGSGKRFSLKGTGFFRLTQVQGRDALVTPEGDLFFQLGVCTVGPCDDYTHLAGRRSLYEWIPPTDSEFATAYLDHNPANFSYYIANVIRKTGKPFDLDSWKGEQADRLRKWGFNSMGAFASHTPALKKRQFPYTPSLPLGKIPTLIDLIFDPYDTETVQLLDRIFSETLPAEAENPLIIGYFISNEQRYTDLLRKLPQFRKDKAAKRELARYLTHLYPDIRDFNHAWNQQLEATDQLADTVLIVRTEQALQDMKPFVEQYLDRYFRLIHDTFRKYDPNHLLLGARFLPAVTRELERTVSICGRYVDIFSINYYSNEIDTEYLSGLNRLSGRPLLLSEWSFGTSEQGLTGGCIDVADEKERGAAYRHYVEQSAALPYVIGNQWFAHLDQALTGRWFQKYNGESMNIGLLNVADRPFKVFLAEAMKSNYAIYEIMLGKRKPFSRVFRSPGQPRPPRSLQIPRALPGMKMDCEYQAWPNRPSFRLGKAELSSGSAAMEFSCDLNLAWDEKYLYFFAVVKEPTPGVNPFTGKDLWRGDAIEFFFGPEKLQRKGPPLFSDRQLIIGAVSGTPFHWFNAPESFPVQTAFQLHPDRNGWTMEGAIPWQAMNITPATGSQFRFDFGIDETDSPRKRLRQFMWSGTEQNSTDRTGWGTAVLVD